MPMVSWPMPVKWQGVQSGIGVQLNIQTMCNAHTLIMSNLLNTVMVSSLLKNIVSNVKHAEHAKAAVGQSLNNQLKVDV